MVGCVKVRYETRQDARGALRELKGRGGPYGSTLRPYRCLEGCGGWHLGRLSRAVIAGKASRAQIYGS